MIDFLPIGLAGLYLWVLASQLHTPLIRPVQRWLRRGWRKPVVSCPWCSGFWIATVGTFTVHGATGRLDWVATPVTVLASAALIGLIGSNWTAGFDDEE